MNEKNGSISCWRVAFAVTDPPGPWSMQFIEVETKYEQVVKDLKPEQKVTYLESRDEARTRAIELNGDIIIPANHL